MILEFSVFRTYNGYMLPLILLAHILVCLCTFSLEHSSNCYNMEVAVNIFVSIGYVVLDEMAEELFKSSTLSAYLCY